MTIALLIWTVIVIAVIGLFTFNASGEDWAVLPILYAIGSFAIASPWIIYGISKLIGLFL